MVIDRAANTLKQAKALSFATGSVNFKDRIGGLDSNDFLRVRLGDRSSLAFSFNGKANLQLLKANGKTIQSTKPKGKVASLDTVLDGGTYYIQVSSAAKKSTRYTLSATASLAHPMSSLEHPMSSSNNAVLNLRTAIPYPQDNQFATVLQGGDDGSTLDIMIVYTAEARQAEGSTETMQKTIQAAVDEVNQGYANSGIIQRLRLVHTAEINYTESGNSDTDLARLQNKTDGYIDEVHPMRDQHGADIVSLFVKNAGSGGIAYTMNQISHEFESYAFSLVQTEAAKTRLSLGHEIGHNLGVGHDRHHAGSDAALPYAYGYINQSGVGDVMSYASARRNVYANPNLSLNGEIMGKENEADVVRAFNNVRFTAANWRKSVV